MFHIHQARFWRDNIPKLRTPAGRAQLATRFIIRLWPRIIAPASCYRRTIVRRTRVVAVVGSLGKTTTTRAVALALGITGRRPSARNEFTFVALAALRIRPWHRHAVIEVGIGAPGQMAMYSRMLRPDIAVVTAVASEHNRSLKSLEITRHEKADMLRGLRSDGLAVLNGDDPNVRWMGETTRARIVMFGLDTANDVRASEVAFEWPHGMTFRVHARGTSAPVRIGLIGRHYIYPALAAIAVGLEAGRTLAEAAAALEALSPVSQRLAPVRTPAGAIILRDEFKSTLESVDAALDVLSEIPARRKIVVLGDVTDCPGNQRDTYRRLGDRIGRCAHRAIFIGSDCQAYASAAFRAGLPRAAIVKADDEDRKSVV